MLNKRIMAKVDFTKGCVVLENGKERTIYVDKKGAWFRTKLKKIYLIENNCKIGV